MNLALAAVSLIVGLFGSAIWLYLLYLILIKIQGTEVMWFLFTIFIPIIIVSQTLSKIIDYQAKK